MAVSSLLPSHLELASLFLSALELPDPLPSSTPSKSPPLCHSSARDYGYVAHPYAPSALPVIHCTGPAFLALSYPGLWTIPALIREQTGSNA